MWERDSGRQTNKQNTKSKNLLEDCETITARRVSTRAWSFFTGTTHTNMVRRPAVQNRNHMPVDRFITERKNNWQRLEDLLALLRHASLRRLRREEVRELGRIYRRTSSDLAIARAESRDPRLINYLNNLVIRAHGRIYQADAQGGARIRNFFAREFPQTFRRTWRYSVTAFSVFALFSVIGFLGTKYDP